MTDRLQQRFQVLLGDRYRIEREIARGGMSTVYLAADRRHDRQVAIKLLQPEITTALTAERFLREIRITARLQHPHILPLLDSGAEDGLCYYVMPHVDGETLRERLMWDRQMDIGIAVGIARQASEALAYAHAQGVIHRDIKPENVLLLHGQAMVADFGLARAVSEAGSGITAAGMPIGTPAYMSPEQAMGALGVDGRSDQYSLGCVLYEMLTGRPPFVGSSVHAIIDLHLNAEPTSMCELRPSIPKALEQMVRRMMAKEVGDRFPEISTVTETLALIAAEEALDHATPQEGGRRPTPRVPEPVDSVPLGGTPSALRSGLVVLGMIMVAVLVILLVLPKGQGPTSSGRSRVASAGFLTSIAAMPLDAIGGDSIAAVMSAGITEEIIAQLSRIPSLKVISRTSVTALTGKGLTVPQIADTLNVQHVLEGSVQRDGNQIRVTLQLIDAETDAHVWSESYTRPFGNMIGLREEIANKVAAELAMAVPGLEATQASPGTRNEAAADALARGMYDLHRASPEALDRAIAAFEEALRADPQYADAAAHLADALALHVHLGYPGRGDNYDVYQQALHMARRAISLDPSSGLGWYARGMARTFTWRPIETALADLERALTLAPNMGDIRIGYGIALARAGRYEDALVASRTAADLDPLSAITRVGGYALTAIGARQYDLAIRETTRALRIDPGFGAAHVVMGTAEYLAGRPERCLALELLGTPGLRALCLDASGDSAAAKTIADSLTRTYGAGQRPLVIYDLGFLAAYHARRGDVSSTIRWLEAAFALSPTGVDFRFVDGGLFDPVRNESGFTTALERMRSRVRERVQ